MRHRLLSAGRWYLDDRSLGVLRAELQGHWLDRLTTGPDTRGGTERCAPAVGPRRGGGADGDRAPALRSGHHDRQIGSLGAGLHRVRLAAIAASAATVAAMGNEESGSVPVCLGCPSAHSHPRCSFPCCRRETAHRGQQPAMTPSQGSRRRMAQPPPCGGCRGRRCCTPNWAAGGSCGRWTPGPHHPGRRKSACVAKSPDHARHGNDDPPPTMRR